MPFAEHTCHTALCDACGDGWEEGPWHFDSRVDLLEFLGKSGWVVAEAKALCQSCAAEADCAATGHQWEGWEDRTMEGVAYRSRWCDHCTHTETDPPFFQLSDLVHAARVINSIGGDRQ